MRIAACLSGNGRTASYCKPYLDRFFRGHEVDYYIHAWQTDSDHIDLFDPKAVSHRAPDDLARLERRVITTFREYCFIRLLPMYWGISEAIRLVPTGEYDLIVRIRPDVVPLNRLNASVQDLDPTSVSFAYHMHQGMHLWTPPTPPQGDIDPSLAGYNDLLFFGSEQAMRPFEHSYALIDDYCAYCEDEEVDLSFTAETLLHFILIQSGVETILRPPISLHLVHEEHVGQPIALYEERSINRSRARRAADTDYVREKHPDLLALFEKNPSLLYPEAQWFHGCYAQGPKSVGSPTLSAAAVRAARSRFYAALG